MIKEIFKRGTAMNTYGSELDALREKLARKGKIEAMLPGLRTQLEALQAEEERLAQIRAQEQSDVDRLEEASLSAFFYSILNRKEEKLDREKAEAYAAAIKHDAAVRQTEATRQDLGELEAELAGLSGIEQRYQTALDARAAAIKAENPAYGAELCHIEDRLGFLTAQCREIDEALCAGQSALSQILSIEKELDSAEGWGTWDLLGGGLISGLAKHSHLDEAQSQVNALQDQLRRYRTELTDVTIQADVQAQIDGFLRFSDFFFDGLFADWAVLDSIHNSQAQIASTHAQVDAVQRRLESMKETVQAEEERLKTQLEELVLKA
jgi:DNA repair exonuclease SbcCD ATPase subunit